MDIKVFETTNYGKFKTIRGNRELNERYLNKLAESIQLNNLLPQNPIIVNERMQVLDGQHRLRVAETLGVSIFYVVAKTGSIREIQLLNTNVRNWTTEDFVRSYIALGKEDYVYLRNFSDRSGLSISNSISLLTGGYGSGIDRKRLIDDFRNGDFKASQKEFANAFIKRLKDVAPFVDGNVIGDRNFLKALDRTYKAGVSQEKLMEKFSASGWKIKLAVGFKDYLRQLEDVLGYKSRLPTRIPLKGKVSPVYA